MKVFIFSFICLFIFYGCSKSSSSKPIAKFSSIEIVSEDGKLVHGKTFSVFYTMDAETEFSGEETVSFYLTQDLNTTNETESEIENSFYLGSQTINYLKTGENTLSYLTSLPQEADISDNFHVHALLSLESNGANDVVYDDDITSAEVISVDASMQGVPNLEISLLEVDNTNILLYENSNDINISEDTEIHAHVTMHSHNVETQDVTLHALIKVDSIWEELEIWDSNMSQYKSVINHDLEPEVSHFHLDINFPPEVVVKIINDINTSNDNKFILRVTLDHYDSVNEVSEDSDNYKDEMIYIYTLFPTPRSISGAVGLHYEKDFAPVLGNKNKIGVEVDSKFDIGANLLMPITPGVYAIADFSLIPYFYSLHANFFELDITAQFIYDYPSGLDTQINMFEKRIFHEFTTWKKLLGKTDNVNIDHNVSIFKDINKTWYKEEVILSEKFLVGPVPMEVDFGLKGRSELKSSFGLERDLYFSGSVPDLELDAFLRGGLDLELIKAGIEGDLDFIDLNLATKNSLGVEFLKYGMGDANSTLFAVEAKSHTGYGIHALSGKFGIYYNFEKLKWCKKYFIKYPCGMKYGQKNFIPLMNTKAAYSKDANITNIDLNWSI